MVLTNPFAGDQAGWATGGMGMARSGATVAVVLPGFLPVLADTWRLPVAA